MATGVLYFSRVPRDMRPNEIREHFSIFGEIFRQKFVVEATNTAKAQALRKRVGKSKALQFKEGWLEFRSYDDAQNAATQMNQQRVAVKNTRRCAGESWCVRCLPSGYRWEDLVTEMEGEKRMRRMKINAELQREREVNEAYRQLAWKEIARRKQQEDGAAGTTGNNNNNNNNNNDYNEGSGEQQLRASDFIDSKKTLRLSKKIMLRNKKAKKQSREAASGASGGESGAAASSAKKKTPFCSASGSSNNNVDRTPKLYTSEGFRDLYNS